MYEESLRDLNRMFKNRPEYLIQNDRGREERNLVNVIEPRKYY